jgi:hypothetical protein
MDSEGAAEEINLMLLIKSMIVVKPACSSAAFINPNAAGNQGKTIRRAQYIIGCREKYTT